MTQSHEQRITALEQHCNACLDITKRGIGPNMPSEIREAILALKPLGGGMTPEQIGQWIDKVNPTPWPDPLPPAKDRAEALARVLRGCDALGSSAADRERAVRHAEDQFPAAQAESDERRREVLIDVLSGLRREIDEDGSTFPVIHGRGAARWLVGEIEAGKIDGLSILRQIISEHPPVERGRGCGIQPAAQEATGDAKQTPEYWGNVSADQLGIDRLTYWQQRAIVAEGHDQRLRIEVDALKAKLAEAEKNIKIWREASATHRCKVCGALWIKHPNNGGWSLRSEKCGKCCDCVAMGDQIEPINGGKELADVRAELEKCKARVKEARELLLVADTGTRFHAAFYDRIERWLAEKDAM